MLTHMLNHTVNILKETDMTKLVYLIVTNGLMLHLILDIIQVVGAGCQCRNTGSRESNL